MEVFRGISRRNGLGTCRFNSGTWGTCLWKIAAAGLILSAQARRSGLRALINLVGLTWTGQVRIIASLPCCVRLTAIDLTVVTRLKLIMARNR